MRHRFLPRAGFSALELLIVLLILIILTGVGSFAVLRTLKHSTFSKGLNDLQDASRQAQMLAMRAPGPIDGEYYGLRLSADNGALVATVVLGDQAVGDQQWNLPASLACYLNGTLETAPDVSWHYQPNTGLTMQRTGSGTYAGPGVQVGVPMPDLSEAPGLDITDVLIIAQQSNSTTPGVEIGLRDGSLRRAMRVLASGAMILEEVTE